MHKVSEQIFDIPPAELMRRLDKFQNALEVQKKRVADSCLEGQDRGRYEAVATIEGQFFYIVVLGLDY